MYDTFDFVRIFPPNIMENRAFFLSLLLVGGIVGKTIRLPLPHFPSDFSRLVLTLKLAGTCELTLELFERREIKSENMSC